MCMLVYLRLDMGYPTCVLVYPYVMHGIYPTLPPHPTPHPPTHTHSTQTPHTCTLHSHALVPPREAKLRSIPVPHSASRTTDQDPPLTGGGGRRLHGVGIPCLVTPRGWLGAMNHGRHQISLDLVSLIL